MAGLNNTDIRLDDNWMLTQAATGDAPTAAGIDCTMQDIRMEAITQAGELFYDEDWGWSLLDFMQSEDDDLVLTEIEVRIRGKLAKRAEIDQESINTEIQFEQDILTISVTFRFLNDSEIQSLNITVDRINVEVTAN